MKTTWLGIIGHNGSGKSTICNYLSTKEFRILSLSDIPREYATARNLSHDRSSLTKLSNELKATHGLNFFAKKIIQSICLPAPRIVFDSIRHPDEIHYLNDFNVKFIGVSAPIEDRFDRIKSRKNSTDHVTFEQFKAHDDYESKGTSSGQHINDCLNLCQYTIQNNADQSQLFRNVDTLLEQFLTPS